MSKELLNCPFCGGEASEWQDEKGNAVYCTRCHIEMRGKNPKAGPKGCCANTGWYDQKCNCNAEALWNTRHLPESAEKVLEVMEETRKYYLQDGSEVSLRHLISKEPEWARNRILVGEEAIADLKASQAEVVDWQKLSAEETVRADTIEAENLILKASEQGALEQVADMRVMAETAEADNKKLREALKPFAQFACGCGDCFNCIAEQALKEVGNAK